MSQSDSKKTKSYKIFHNDDWIECDMPDPTGKILQCYFGFHSKEIVNYWKRDLYDGTFSRCKYCSKKLVLFYQ